MITLEYNMVLPAEADAAAAAAELTADCGVFEHRIRDNGPQAEPLRYRLMARAFAQDWCFGINLAEQEFGSGKTWEGIFNKWGAKQREWSTELWNKMETVASTHGGQYQGLCNLTDDGWPSPWDGEVPTFESRSKGTLNIEVGQWDLKHFFLFTEMIDAGKALVDLLGIPEYEEAITEATIDQSEGDYGWRLLVYHRIQVKDTCSVQHMRDVLAPGLEKIAAAHDGMYDFFKVLRG